MFETENVSNFSGFVFPRGVFVYGIAYTTFSTKRRLEETRVLLDISVPHFGNIKLSMFREKHLFAFTVLRLVSWEKLGGMDEHLAVMCLT
jgi:hypothetical protein